MPDGEKSADNPEPLPIERGNSDNSPRARTVATKRGLDRGMENLKNGTFFRGSGTREWNRQNLSNSHFVRTVMGTTESCLIMTSQTGCHDFLLILRNVPAFRG
ncbi:MAG: hypothetical protein SWY16_26470, partial [Cyanobacteriota bacterium]|nr:hypothetical protein [Cyanobacteriota bacterium]